MPNRIIKETICISENLNSLTPEEEVFFYRLMVNCDDFGIMDARPMVLRAKCFPVKIDKIKDKEVDKWLQALVREDLIFIYEFDDKKYLKMKSWEKHQQIRAKRSKYPTPDMIGANMITNDINCNQTQSNVPVIQSNPIQSESKSESNTNTKKQKYADYVSLYPEEYEKLVKEFGEDNTKKMIEKLDNYKGSSGKKYKDDYRTILNWVKDEVLKGTNEKKPAYKKMEQHQYTEDDFNKLIDNMK